MRWEWQNELWPDRDWAKTFMRRRMLYARHLGTVRAAERNYYKNRKPVPCGNDFLNAEYE